MKLKGYNIKENIGVKLKQLNIESVQQLINNDVKLNTKPCICR